MKLRYPLLLVTIAAAVLALAPASAQAPSPRDPVFNGQFELNSPAGETLAGTPADACIGIGHQALYGSESPQGQATGGTYDNPNPSQADPVGAAQGVAANPVEAALFASGYENCYSGSEGGYDACWCNPAGLASDDAVHWSGHDDDAVGDSGRDDAPDREVTIGYDTDTSHNLWQAYPSPHQAYSGNFDALSFDVEAGSIPSNAHVDVTFDVVPFEAQSPYAGFWGECQLTFSASQFSSGSNSVPAVDGSFKAREPVCQDAADAWNDPSTTDAQRREILGRLRIVQLSFWNWDNVGSPSERVVLDDVSLPGATLAAEEAAQGNVRVNPQPPAPSSLVP